MPIQAVVDCIKANKRFLITTHTNLEGDALGSLLSMHKLLEKAGKKAVMVIDDVVPYGYEFLSGCAKIRKYNKTLRLDYDVYVALDCSDKSRSGQVPCLIKANAPILNIDHHISNSRFGSVNWIDPRAASCSEMMFLLYRRMDVPLDKETALLLYTGILTDTGSFRYPNTTSRTHKIAGELLEYGIDPSVVFKKVYENIPPSDIELLLEVLPRINYEMGGKIAWYQINAGLLRKRKKIYFDLTDQVLGFARAIKGVEAVVLFKENLDDKREVRVNFRSQGQLDVNKVASSFGGGGHKTAAGATLKGSINTIRKRVLKKVMEGFKKQWK